jgi:hypothetical protein
MNFYQFLILARLHMRLSARESLLLSISYDNNADDELQIEIPFFTLIYLKFNSYGSHRSVDPPLIFPSHQYCLTGSSGNASACVISNACLLIHSHFFKRMPLHLGTQNLKAGLPILALKHLEQSTASVRKRVLPCLVRRTSV